MEIPNPELKKEALQRFQAIIADIMNNPQKRAELKTGMQSEGISEVTLYRWANKFSTPRTTSIVALMKHCAVEDRENLAPLVEYLVGSHVSEVPLSKPVPLVSSIPSAFYERILTALAEQASSSRRFTTIAYLVLHQMLHHLDPFHVGLEIVVSQLLPPADATIYCLRERVSLCTEELSTLEPRWAFLGAESPLECDAISSLSDQMTVQRDRVAVPFLRAGRICGCVSIKSSFAGYFTPDMQKLVHGYAKLISLAFEDHEFYEQASISFLALPSAEQQKSLFETLHQRKITLMQQDRLSNRQAEEVALQDIAKEMSEVSVK